jgi:hypothetical protein
MRGHLDLVMILHGSCFIRRAIARRVRIVLPFGLRLVGVSGSNSPKNCPKRSWEVGTRLYPRV